jgi:endonuclease III
MSTRVEKFEQLHKSLKKHFKFNEVSVERTVLEHLLYACCLEDARCEQADEAFAKLQQSYFDWNEVRVTTTIELSDVLSSLPNPAAAGHRIKRCLQSLFETRYQFDLEDMKKANLGKAMEEMQAWQGMTQFVLNYTSQHALGGHAIPIDSCTVDALWAAGILTDAEADKKSVSGAERAIPKNKGDEFASLLHQFGVEFSLNKKHAGALAVFKELGVTPKVKPAPAEPSANATSLAKNKAADSKKETKPESSDKAKAGSKDSVTVAKETPAPSATGKKDLKADSSMNDGDAKSAAAAKKPTEAKSSAKPKDAPKGISPEKPSKVPGKTTEKPTDKPLEKAPVKEADKKPPIKVTKDSGKADSAKLDASKSAPAKGTPAKPKPPAAKPAAAKPVTGKPAKGKESSDKPKASKAKEVKKPEKKSDTKKVDPASKKPAKLANNVKITKKKPK